MPLSDRKNELTPRPESCFYERTFISYSKSKPESITSFYIGEFAEKAKISPRRQIVQRVVLNIYAYLAESSGVRVVNISDPFHPEQAGALALPDAVRRGFVQGNYFYLASGELGLCVLDISDPANPAEVGSYDTPGMAADVWMEGSFAYVADGEGGVRVLDVSQPANPTEIGAFDVSGIYGTIAKRLIVNEQIAYVLYDNWAITRLLDVSDPEHISELSQYNAGLFAQSIALDNSSLYILGSGLFIQDITIPSGYESGRYLPGIIRDIAAMENFAYIALDGGLLIVDATNPLSSVVTNYQPLPDIWLNDYPGNTNGVAVSQDDSVCPPKRFAYITSTGNGL